eukprot:TRINITY_DN24009_c1_g1_i2.p1 TRINITY_DN24009_c1_g1~~TRINITY_DN24009_c1_g1_i2.p1  ORF type:complete len:440 (-),score=74.11 TRINITY_DN24009_c1_g1_i2:190-1509(-)
MIFGLASDGRWFVQDEPSPLKRADGDASTSGDRTPSSSSESGGETPVPDAWCGTAGSLSFVSWLSEPARPKTRSLALASGQLAVAVVGPGAGVGVNNSVYRALKRDHGFVVDFVGRSHSAYDRYPQAWPHGCPPPNLDTFGRDIALRGTTEQTDCLVFGSRGGQVVLPRLWRDKGAGVPPAIVINGGCAMDLPVQIEWPDSAITFHIIGGRDYFKRNFTPEQYVDDARRHVPQGNSTTAILYVREMEHMPAATLLASVLRRAICAAVAWKKSGEAPHQSFGDITDALCGQGWTGCLLYTTAAGVWETMPFLGEASPAGAQQGAAARQAARTCEAPEKSRFLLRAGRPHESQATSGAQRHAPQQLPQQRLGARPEGKVLLGNIGGRSNGTEKRVAYLPDAFCGGVAAVKAALSPPLPPPPAPAPPRAAATVGRYRPALVC